MKTPQNSPGTGADAPLPQPMPAYDFSPGAPLSPTGGATHMPHTAVAANRDDALKGHPIDISSKLGGGRGVWSTQISAARAKWDKLGEDELVKTNGHSIELALLLEKRYGIQRAEAERQVSRFLAEQTER